MEVCSKAGLSISRGCGDLATIFVVAGNTIAESFPYAQTPMDMHFLSFASNYILRAMFGQRV